MIQSIHRFMQLLTFTSDAQLRAQLQYLRVENQILRSKIKGPVRVTPQERSRLIQFAKPLGKAIRELTSIVQPDTFLRWMKGYGKRTERGTAYRGGKRRTPEDTRRLILQMANDTNWGITKITGELRKIGITIGKTTVQRILKQAGVPSGPLRSESRWSEFIKSHAKTLWACDFMTQRVLTRTGFKDAYLLIFMHIASRRIVLSPATLKPDSRWMNQQARLLVENGSRGNEAILLHDRDTKFTTAFKRLLRKNGVKPFMLPHASPNLNAHVERFIQTLQNECLDRFIVMGRRHMDYLTSEFAQHYNRERPHSAIGYRTPTGPPLPESIGHGRGRVRCRTRLGGILKHYYRTAA